MIIVPKQRKKFEKEKKGIILEIMITMYISCGNKLANKY